MSFVTAITASSAASSSSSSKASTGAAAGMMRLIPMGFGGAVGGGAAPVTDSACTSSSTHRRTWRGGGTGMGSAVVDVDVDEGDDRLCAIGSRGSSGAGPSARGGGDVVVVEDDDDGSDDDDSLEDVDDDSHGSDDSSLEDLQSYRRGDDDDDDDKGSRVMGIQAWPGRRCLDEDFSGAASLTRGSKDSYGCTNLYINFGDDTNDDEISRLAVGQALLSTVFRQGSTTTGGVRSSDASISSEVPRVVSNDDDDEEDGDDGDDDDDDELARRWQVQLQQNNKKEQQWQLLLATIESANSSGASSLDGGGGGTRRGHNLSTIVEEEDDDDAGEEFDCACDDDNCLQLGDCIDSDCEDDADGVESAYDEVIDLLLRGDLVVDDENIHDGDIDAWLDLQEGGLHRDSSSTEEAMDDLEDGGGNGHAGATSYVDIGEEQRNELRASFLSLPRSIATKTTLDPPRTLPDESLVEWTRAEPTTIATAKYVPKEPAAIGPNGERDAVVNPSQLWLQLPSILPRVLPRLDAGDRTGDSEVVSPPKGEQQLLQQTLDCIAALAFCG